MYTLWITATISIPKVLSNVLFPRLWKQGKLSSITPRPLPRETVSSGKRKSQLIFSWLCYFTGLPAGTQRAISPILIDKNHKQTESQANGRMWASRLRYSEPQDTSAGWSTLLCCSLHPRDSASPDEDSHYCELFLSLSAHSLVLVLSHEMFSVKQKFDLCCDWTPAVPWHWTAIASCKTLLPRTKIRGNYLSPLCYWFLILWNEVIAKQTNKHGRRDFLQERGNCRSLSHIQWDKWDGWVQAFLD